MPRGLFVMITIVAYVISKIGGSLFAGSIVLEVVAGLNLWQAAPLILVATGIYTLAGGLTVRTDAGTVHGISTGKMDC